MTKSVGL